MSGIKEVRKKIASIKSTQKITRAMEMVAASKMRRAKEVMGLSQPYAEKIRTVISHVVEGQLEYQHPFMSVRPIKRVGYIIISTDRGLCGGLNINLFRGLCAHMQQRDKQAIAQNYYTIGKKAEYFFKRMPGDFISSISEIGKAPTLSALVGTVKVVLKAYESEEVDQVFLAYNKFVNTMTQEPRIEQLLPIQRSEEKSKNTWDYIYEPEAPYLLDLLLTRYVESLVYQGVAENSACEQAARMVAMKSATDNAGELIDELELVYNKVRQATITRELSEIVSGADAV
jgi:F-type H+-transporting ATPase subunit gamma